MHGVLRWWVLGGLLLARSAWAQEGDDVVLPDLGLTAASFLPDGPRDPDVLVLYTSAAAAAVEDVVRQIEDAEAFRRLAYERSAMLTTGGGVFILPLARQESGSLGQELQWLQADPDVAALRDSLAADVVALITGASGRCGIGYLMTDISPAFEAFAFSVTDVTCLPSTYAHELGHNMGCHHDPEHTSGTWGVTDFAFGHRQCEADGFRTIMAYPCPNGVARIANYSNPLIVEGPWPTGIMAEDCAVHGACRDCAAAIDLTAPLVAAFRARELTTSTSTMLLTTTSTTSTTTVTTTTVTTTTLCAPLQCRRLRSREAKPFVGALSKRVRHDLEGTLLCAACEEVLLVFLDDDADVLCTQHGFGGPGLLSATMWERAVCEE